MPFDGVRCAKGKIVFDELSQLDVAAGISGNIDSLKEDMLQIEYPGNRLVDAGWYPSFDPDGAFIVQLIRDFDWENPVYQQKCRDFDALEQALNDAMALCN